jgi:hypothetical protein
MGNRWRGRGQKTGVLKYYADFTLREVWRKFMCNPLTECGAVEEFSGCRQVGCVQAIDLPGRRPFALSAALSAQAGADSVMERNVQHRPSVGAPGRCHRAMVLTARPIKAWASRRRKRNAESRRR